MSNSKAIAMNNLETIIVSTDSIHVIPDATIPSEIKKDICTSLLNKGFTCVNEKFKCYHDCTDTDIIGKVFVNANKTIFVVTAMDGIGLMEQMTFTLMPYYLKENSYQLMSFDVPTYMPDNQPWFKKVERFNGKLTTLCSNLGCQRGDYKRVMLWLTILDMFDFINTERVDTYTTRLKISGIGLRLAIDFGNSNTFGILYDHPLYGERFAKMYVDEFWKALILQYSGRNPEYRINEMISSGLIKTAKVSDIMALYDEDLKNSEM